MNVTHTKTGDLEAKLEVVISAKEDLQPRVTSVLKNLRKTGSFKGFRQGAVPMSFVKKKYEKGVKLDELNKLVSENMNEYLRSEKLQLIAEPLPVPNDDFDFDSDEYKFEFELGFYPEFEPNIEEIKLNRKEIYPDDETFNNAWETMLKQERIREDAEEIQEAGAFSLEFELPNFNVPQEEEAQNESNTKYLPLLVENLKNPSDFIGKKIDETQKFVLENLVKEEETPLIQRDLGMNPEEWENVKSLELEGKVNQIQTLKPAELNAELFKKVLGKDIETEEDFKDEFGKLIVAEYQRIANQEMTNEFFEKYGELNTPELPENFVAKLIEAQQKEEEVSIDPEKEMTALKKEIANNRLIEKHELKPTNDEIRTSLKERMTNIPMYAQLGEEFLNQMVEYSLNDKEAFNREYEMAMFEKVIDFILKEVNVTNERVDMKAYEKELDEKHKTNEAEAQPKEETVETESE